MSAGLYTCLIILTKDTPGKTTLLKLLSSSFLTDKPPGLSVIKKTQTLQSLGGDEFYR